MILLNSFTSNQINKLQKFFNAHGTIQLKETLTNCSDDLFVEALYLCLLNKIPSNTEIDGDRLLLHATDREKLINRFHSLRATSTIPDTVDYPVNIEKIIPLAPIIEILPVSEPTIETTSAIEPDPPQPPIKKPKTKSHINQTNKS